jgi:hypothetical protein
MAKLMCSDDAKRKRSPYQMIPFMTTRYPLASGGTTEEKSGKEPSAVERIN